MSLVNERRGRGAPGQARVPREVREREMRTAAARLFAQRGYTDTSMDEIADDVGISKPMLYAYFGSKEGLFIAVAAEAAYGLGRQVRAAAGASGLSPDQRLWQGILAVFDFVDEHSDAWRILYPNGEAPAGLIGQAARRAREGMGDLLGELFASNAGPSGVTGAAARHLVALGQIFTAATITAASWWLEHPEDPKEIHALRLMNFAWIGFSGLGEGRSWTP